MFNMVKLIPSKPNMLYGRRLPEQHDCPSNSCGGSQNPTTATLFVHPAPRMPNLEQTCHQHPGV